MIILRQKNYSKNSKSNNDDNNNEKKKTNIKSALAISSGGVIALGSDKISSKIIEKSGKKFDKSLNKQLKDSQKINEKLKQKAKDWGVKISEGKESAYNKQLDSISLNRLDKQAPPILAHELGHAAMNRKGRSKDILGKAAHTRIADSSRGLVLLSNKHIDLDLENKKQEKSLKRLRPVLNADLFMLGATNGLDAAMKENDGDKKEARKQIRRGMIAPALITAPMLIQEGAASRKGLKLLKESGANKESVKQARKTLGHAFGTYAGAATKPILLHSGGTGVGYGIGKLSNISNKEKEHDNTKK